MPSPRAVLCDIHDLKLDPTKAHRDVKASGRLAAPESAAAAAKLEVSKPKKSLKTALAELVVKNDETKAPSVEPEPVAEPAADAESAAKKLPKPVKKKEEKKSEVPSAN